MKVATIYKRQLGTDRNAPWTIARPHEWAAVESVVRAVKSLKPKPPKDGVVQVATKYVEAAGLTWKIQLVEI